MLDWADEAASWPSSGPAEDLPVAGLTAAQKLDAAADDDEVEAVAALVVVVVAAVVGDDDVGDG